MSGDDLLAVGERIAKADLERARALSPALVQAVPCPCGKAPAADACAYGVVLYCRDCYDGAEDAGPQLTGSGESLALAIQHWNDSVEEQRE